MLDNKGFDLWADGYDKTVGVSNEENTYPFAGYKDVLGTIYKTIMKKANAVVLDIGFGTGTLTTKLYENGCVSVQVRDRGTGIPDVARAMEPLYTTGGEERSGLGFSVMQSFTDRLRVRSAPGKGTAVTMEKYIAPRVKGRV